MIKKVLLLKLIFVLIICRGFSQGYNHQWLLGKVTTVLDTNTSSLAAKILFNSSTDTVIGVNRKMAFGSTQATICDANGNFLFGSNGCWIMDASGDTMQNGSDLNPGLWANSYCSGTSGMPMSGANVIIPFPGDLSKYILFHQIGNFNFNQRSTELFYTVIDMNLNGGLGGVVTSQKNIIALTDTLNKGFAACRHANGRDWWIIMQKDSSDVVFNILFTPNGIDTIFSQHLNVPVAWGNVTQLTFSQDGNQFAYTTYSPNTVDTTYALLFNFDRCTGMFSNERVVFLGHGFLWGDAFSPSGAFLYSSKVPHMLQINTNTLDVDTVAIYDGFISPGPSCCQTTFFFMYLAANGKIYVTSGSTTESLHEINSPDSAGLACNVQQHAINLGYIHYRSVPNHPNYYLGCDTTGGCPCLTISIEEPGKHNFKFSISPNPSSGNFKITYLLPQSASGGKSGTFEIIDINGKNVFSYNLPPWSTLQQFNLPKLADGIYECIIKSGGFIAGKKLIIMK